MQSNPWKIEKPALEDIPQIMKLWKEESDFHYALDPDYYLPFEMDNAENFRAYTQKAIEQNTPNILTAKDASKIVGFATFSIGKEPYFDTKIKQYGEVLEIIVTKTYRNRGIGGQLLQAVEKHLAKQNIPHFKLQVSSFNHRALKFYKDLGYVDRQRLLFKPIRK